MNYFIKIFFLTIILINSSLADDISLNEPNKIGDTTIKIIDHEIKRYVVRINEFKKKSEHLQTL